MADHLLMADWTKDIQTPSGQILEAKVGGKLWATDKIAELVSRIIALVRDVDSRIFVMTNEIYRPYGRTGKVYFLK